MNRNIRKNAFYKQECRTDIRCSALEKLYLAMFSKLTKIKENFSLVIVMKIYSINKYILHFETTVLLQLILLCHVWQCNAGSAGKKNSHPTSHVSHKSKLVCKQIQLILTRSFFS